MNSKIILCVTGNLLALLSLPLTAAKEEPERPESSLAAAGSPQSPAENSREALMEQFGGEEGDPKHVENRRHAVNDTMALTQNPLTETEAARLKAAQDEIARLQAELAQSKHDHEQRIKELQQETKNKLEAEQTEKAKLQAELAQSKHDHEQRIKELQQEKKDKLAPLESEITAQKDEKVQLQKDIAQLKDYHTQITELKRQLDASQKDSPERKRLIEAFLQLEKSCPPLASTHPTTTDPALPEKP